MKTNRLKWLFASVALFTTIDFSRASDLHSISSGISGVSLSTRGESQNWRSEFRDIQERWESAPKQPLEVPEWLIRAAALDREDERRRQELINTKLRRNESDPRFRQEGGGLLDEIKESNGRAGKYIPFNSSNIQKLKKERKPKHRDSIPDYTVYKNAKASLQDLSLSALQKKQKAKIVAIYEKFWQEIDCEYAGSNYGDTSYETDSETRLLDKEFLEFVWQYENGQLSANLNEENENYSNELSPNNIDRISKLENQRHEVKKQNSSWQGLEFAAGDDVFGYLLAEMEKVVNKDVFKEAASKAELRNKRKVLAEEASKRQLKRAQIASLLVELISKVKQDERRQKARQACLEVLKGKQLTENQKENLATVLGEMLGSNLYEDSTEQSFAYAHEVDEYTENAETSFASSEEGTETGTLPGAGTETSLMESPLILEVQGVDLPGSLPAAITLKQKAELLLENSMLHNIIISRRLMQVAAPSAGDENISYGLWLSGLVATAKQDSVANNSRYKANSRNIAIGFDGELANGHILGLAGSVSNSKINVGPKANHYKTDSLSASIYHQMPIQFFGKSDYQLHNRLSASHSKLKSLSLYIHGKMSSYSIGARTELVKEVSLLHSENSAYLSLLPSVHLGYDFLHAGKFKAGNQNSYYLRLKSNNAHRIQAGISAKIRGSLKANCGNSIKPEISAGVTRYHYTRPTAINGYAEVGGVRIEQSAKGIDSNQKTILTLGTAVEFGVSDSVFAVHYDCNIAKGYIGQQASLRLRVEL